MTDEELREAWLRLRDESIRDGIGSKQITDALLALIAAYKTLSAEERTVIDQLLIDQLTSNSESTRFDALALIREFQITSALSNLFALIARLEQLQSPGSPFEHAKVRRLISDLSDGL